MRKDSHRQLIILEDRFAGLTYGQIAGKLGISRQRVQQLISPPSYIRQLIVDRARGKCQICGLQVNGSGHVHHKSCIGEDYNDTENLQLLCVSCHRKQHGKLKPACLQCGQPVTSYHGKYCSAECYSLYCRTNHIIKFVCFYCGKEYAVGFSKGNNRIKHNQSGMFFCSKQCQGKWFAESHGFVAHPENIGGKKMPQVPISELG